MSSGSITVTSSNSSNILVSTVNPISNTSKNADWTYMLMPYVEGASSNIYDVTIVNPSGITIYGCILGPGGFGGNYKNWNNGTYSAGGGGGGMGGFINYIFPNSTSSSGDNYEVTINNVGSQSHSKISCSSLGVSVSAHYGKNGGNGSEDSTGSGGNGADCDTSDASGIESTGTYYGGGGGGSGATESSNGCSVSQGGIGGTGATLDGEPGIDGSSGGNGGDGGGTTITFSDGTTYSETGGRGGKPFNNGISGPLSWAMIYFKSNSQTVTISTSPTAITPSITVTLTKIDVENGVTTTKTETNTISVSTVNPLTYYSGGFTYILVECPQCSYSDDDNETYYTCSWSVPITGTYYCATVAPGGPAGLHTTHQDQDGGENSGDPNYTGMSGGGGNGTFINGKLINGYTYTYTMWDFSRNPKQKTSETNETTKSNTYNELIATDGSTTYGPYKLKGADLPGYYYKKNSTEIRGGDGSYGRSYSDNSGSYTDLFNEFTCYGGGGAGGGGAAMDGGNSNEQDSSATVYGGNGGNGGSGLNSGQSGTNGKAGAQNSDSSWPYHKDSEPGQSTYIFSDASSTLISAGSGGYGGNTDSNEALSQSTSGVATLLMIYYKS